MKKKMINKNILHLNTENKVCYCKIFNRKKEGEVYLNRLKPAQTQTKFSEKFLTKEWSGGF